MAPDPGGEQGAAARKPGSNPRRRRTESATEAPPAGDIAPLFDLRYSRLSFLYNSWEFCLCAIRCLPVILSYAVGRLSPVSHSPTCKFLQEAVHSSRIYPDVEAWSNSWSNPPPSDFAPDPEIEKPRNQNYQFSDKHTNLEMDIEIEFDNFCLT